jgi:hypothetical protein
MHGDPAGRGPTRLVAYFGNRYLHHFERDLEEICEHGFDAVVHCVTEADREWGMKRIAELFALTRDAGLSCWADPWGLAGVFGGEAHSGYRARGGTVGADDRGLRALLRRWIADVAAAGAEWLFWDEPHLGVGRGSDELVAFLHELADHGREHGLRNSVCLTSTVPNMVLFPKLAAIDSIDDIGTDPYYRLDVDETDPEPEDYVGVWAERLRATAARHGKTCHVWVQAFNIAAGREEQIARCVEVARARGAGRIGVWGFRACEALDIRPARPDVAWRVVGEAIRAARSGSAARPGLP